ncbi:MAG: tetratricopeptide repeat protein [Pirellulales bacterium]
MPTRRERIEALLALEPHDSLLRYGLGIEWEKEGQIERALESFRGLMSDAPPYVPAFFRAAQMLAAAERVDEARTLLRDGIEAARRQGDLHAAGEMSEFLASLGR